MVTSSNDLHAGIGQFYADQMAMLDTGDTTGWAATFAEDGVFAANGLPEPVSGRTAIATSATAARAALREAGIVHRHWLGMLTVDSQADGTVRARSYALVIATKRGGESSIHRSTVCEDLLVPANGSWQVRRREVRRDDLDDSGQVR